jgi:glycosyltransferase involved in cell wall biosynthesis
LKVALLSDWYLPRLGGLELHIRDLARALTTAGCDVHVVTPTPASLAAQATGLPAVALPHPRGVVVHRLDVPLLPRHKLVYTPSALASLQSLFTRERYDVVHAMVSIVSPASMAGAWVACRLGVPTVVTFHSMLFGFRPVLRALDRAFSWSRWPALFSAVSGVVAAEVHPLVRGRPVHVLPNGVDAGAWEVEHVPGPPEKLRVASVMRLNARKRGAALLHALARAQREVGSGVHLRLTLVGEGPQGSGLRRLARRLGLGAAVRFAGYLPREGVRDVLARSDVFALAARLESFGIAALEARAAGVPVVALNVGGVRELVRDGRDGLLAGSDRELAGRLAALARDRALLERLRAGACERPVPCSWEEALGKHLAAYHAVIAGATPARLDAVHAGWGAPAHRPDAA